MLAGKTVLEFEVEDLGNVIIRYPTMNDAEDLREKFNKLVEEGAEILAQEKIESDKEAEWLAEKLAANEKKEEIFLVIEINDKVMGDVGIRKKDEPTLAHVGELGISLREEIRGKGIGTRVSNFLMKKAREELDIEIVTLRFFHTNNVARKLYEKLGFKEVGKVEDGAYHEGSYKDLIKMRKDLREGF